MSVKATYEGVVLQRRAGTVSRPAGSSTAAVQGLILVDLADYGSPRAVQVLAVKDQQKFVSAQNFFWSLPQASTHRLPMSLAMISTLSFCQTPTHLHAKRRVSALKIFAKEPSAEPHE